MSHIRLSFWRIVKWGRLIGKLGVEERGHCIGGSCGERKGWEWVGEYGGSITVATCEQADSLTDGPTD